MKTDLEKIVMIMKLLLGQIQTSSASLNLRVGWCRVTDNIPNIGQILYTNASLKAVKWVVGQFGTG